MSEVTQFPSELFTHSVKIIHSKGVRIDVHVCATDKDSAVLDALNTYVKAKDTAKKHNIPLAPIETRF